MSGGKSLALFEVEVAEVGTCFTLWATEGLATIPANSGPIKSSRDSSVANGSDSCKEKILKNNFNMQKSIETTDSNLYPLYGNVSL